MWAEYSYNDGLKDFGKPRKTPSQFDQYLESNQVPPPTYESRALPRRHLAIYSQNINENIYT